MTTLIVPMQETLGRGPAFDGFRRQPQQQSQQQQAQQEQQQPVTPLIVETTTTNTTTATTAPPLAETDENTAMTDNTAASMELTTSTSTSPLSSPMSIPDEAASEREDFTLSHDSQMLDLNLETNQSAYGGLDNLGNTCYLNSAMQMIASLDDFTDRIRQHVPIMEQDNTPEEQPTSTTSTLRQCLLDVLERLQKGETVRPETFKNKIDERTPLFIGYRQQDSHEFLTSLLDLLDEDYKRQQERDSGDDNVNDDDGDRDHDRDGEAPIKKQRLDQQLNQQQEQDEESMASTTPLPSPTLSTSHSFKDLKFKDIENLLHGDESQEASPSNSSISNNNNNNNKSGKYKLVGGRMNPSGVTLTKWEESGGESTADGADPAPSSDQLVLSTCSDNDSGMEQEAATVKPYSPVDDYFTTKVRVCLTCNSCKYRRSHQETYLHLSLEIGSTIASVEEGLRAFFKPEKREIKCEKCFHDSAMQTTEITKLPRALLCHLKRFIVDVSPDYTSISYRKNQSPVAFEPTLALEEHEGVLGEVLGDEVALPQNARYGVRSIVHHIGSSASCGHYTADGHRREDMSVDREWIRFNDSYASKITSEDAIDKATSTAYMILYELEGKPDSSAAVE